jgi:LDH2 family malate/lactate/ureidoglycolate dehydrogenase
MAPWGGRKMAVGNNPWSIAAPAGRHAPMVLDISNTIVARGKIHVAKQRGLPIPAGWALNGAGEPTTDAAEALTGLILPMAEHKGYAISTMIDVLSGVLTGSSFSTGVSGPHQAKRRAGCGHLAIALDIERFMPMSEFSERMEKLVDTLRSTPAAPGFEQVFYPGEIEVFNERRNREHGLKLPEKTLGELMKLASEVGVGG